MQKPSGWFEPTDKVDSYYLNVVDAAGLLKVTVAEFLALGIPHHASYFQMGEVRHLWRRDDVLQHQGVMR